MSVEALLHKAGRDPPRELAQAIKAQLHIGLAHNVEKFALASLDGFAAFKIAHILELATVALIGQQDPCFLNGFMNRANPKGALRRSTLFQALALNTPFRLLHRHQKNST